MKTEFNDISGKPIYTGDLVQYRLGGNNSIMTVVKHKNRIKLVDSRYVGTNSKDTYKNHIPMGKTYEKYVSIVDTSGRQINP